MKYFSHSEVYDSIKTCSQSGFSTKEYINTCDTVVTLRSYSDLQELQFYFNLLYVITLG